jgi:phenylalanine-4-hydroxylase
MNLQKNGKVISQNEYDYTKYTEEEHLTWKILFDRQVDTLSGKACKEFIDGLKKLRNIIQAFPNLNTVSDEIYKILGWKLYPVTGLLNHDDYFKLLLKKQFPVAVFVRDSQNIDFSPYPDMWHDIFGHLPFLFSPVYRDFVEYISEKMLTVNEDVKKQIGSLYWYTIEAGVCQENGERRIYGASQVSSFHEIAYAVSNEPTVLPFDLQKILSLKIENEEVQTTLFEIPSFDYLETIKTEFEAQLNKSV